MIDCELDIQNLPAPPPLTSKMYADQRREELEQADSRKRQLLRIMLVRAMTQEEEDEAIEFGEDLNIFLASFGRDDNQYWTESYREDDKRRDLSDRWFQQRRLQKLARS